ncbi:hypothetical protein QLL95_gp0618 [Cotonvirus japonicus]|uniref:Uncharacterized protein n=1 Tax=Cotonvirus japonicus TaxID=2811091 RepID=A0ABM7NTK7_9VIRU|nr:hypothetical protein QLL95_gp0618 [Cotonvirus japonicus]BCS83505.1 hypothetical protein [Cotonvirus japonicus]
MSKIKGDVSFSVKSEILIINRMLSESKKTENYVPILYALESENKLHKTVHLAIIKFVSDNVDSIFNLINKELLETVTIYKSTIKLLEIISKSGVDLQIVTKINKFLNDLIIEPKYQTWPTNYKYGQYELYIESKLQCVVDLLYEKHSKKIRDYLQSIINDFLYSNGGNRVLLNGCLYLDMMEAVENMTSNFDNSMINYV